jgi:hypothetical protein
MAIEHYVVFHGLYKSHDGWINEKTDKLVDRQINCHGALRKGLNGPLTFSEDFQRI